MRGGASQAVLESQRPKRKLAMSGFDVGVLAVLAVFALRGYRRGMGREMASVLAVAGALWFAVTAAPGFAENFGGFLGERFSKVLDLAALVIVYLVAYLGLRIVLAVARRLWISVGISVPSRVAGTVLGGLKAAAVMGLAVALLEGSPPFEGMSGSLPAPAAAPVEMMGERISDSLLAPTLAGLTGQVVSALIAVGGSTSDQARTYSSGAS